MPGYYTNALFLAVIIAAIFNVIGLLVKKFLSWRVGEVILFSSGVGLMVVFAGTMFLDFPIFNEGFTKYFLTDFGNDILFIGLTADITTSIVGLA